MFLRVLNPGEERKKEKARKGQKIEKLQCLFSPRIIKQLQILLQEEWLFRDLNPLKNDNMIEL